MANDSTYGRAPRAAGGANLERLEDIRGRLTDLLQEVDTLGLPFMVYLVSLATAELNAEILRRREAS